MQTIHGITLVKVTDIFGGTWLVREDQLTRPTPDFLPLYTQRGRLLADLQPAYRQKHYGNCLTLHRSNLATVEPGVAAVWKLPVYAGFDWEKGKTDLPAFYLTTPTPYQQEWAQQNYANGKTFALYFGNFKCRHCGQARVLACSTSQYRCYACNEYGDFA